MLKIRHILTSLLMCSAIILAKATETQENISFIHLSVDEGLSQRTVLSSSQDTLGQMWFATLDGLNRYDGYEFHIYRNNPEDTTTIANNIIRKVYTDHSGRLWIGTGKGLSLYNTETDAFLNFTTNDRQVTGIADAGKNRIMVAAGGDLMFFDTKSMRWVEDKLLQQAGNIRATVLYDEDEEIWIGTVSSGLFCWSSQTESIRRVMAAENGSRPIQCIIKHHNRLYMATEGDGLWYYDTTTGKSNAYRQIPNNNNSISSNYVRTLSTDSEDRLWIGTYNGLSIYENGNFTNICSNPFKEGSLSQSSVRCIKKDNQGGMWLGTYFGGLNYWHPLMNKFNIIQRQPSGNSLNDNIVSCIAEDKDRALWIGTNSGGVNYYNPGNNNFKVYTLRREGRPSLESDDIKTIFVDEKSKLVYVGAHAGGLSSINPLTGKVTHYKNQDKPDQPMNVYAIIDGGNDKLWIGTLEGIKLFDKKTKQFKDIINDLNGNPIKKNEIKAMMKDSDGVLWVGGDYGLQTFTIKNEQLCKKEILVKEEILSDSFVQCFCESSTSVIWAGTRSGLLCINPEDNSVKKYDMNNGLPSDIIHGLEEDNMGRIWISTDRGLSCLNPFTGQFRNFSTDDGLKGNQFNPGSCLKRSNGEIMFGGIGGITAFFPESMKDNPYAPQPIITSLKVFGNEIKPCKSIVLKHDQNSISLEFSVPNYLAGHHNTFAYTLEGYSKQWFKTSDIRRVVWSNLPHGRYKFMVKAANNDGVWNPTPTVMEIIIRPVWYLTWVAKISFAILLIIGFFASYRFVVRRKEEESRLELAKQEKVHQEDIHQMKMKFYINISHEMRTPLTLIINPLSEMTAKCNDTWMRKQLKYVERNAQRLLHLVNQLMDYRRAELDVFKLKVREEDILRIIKENWTYYEKLATRKKIKYTLNSNLENRKALVDGQYIELILNNLLSNAFKYTDKGSISVNAFLTKECLTITVSDTGTGIPLSKQDKIFERFYQMEREHIGSGIGLSLVHRLVELHHGKVELESEEGKGTTFTVTLPQDSSIYNEDELGSDKEEEIHSVNSKDMYVIDSEDVEELNTEEENIVKRGKILIVEDNEEVSRYMQSGLSGTFDVVAVQNGAEAVEKMKTFQTDIVITDMVMPVMDGIKLCAHIKQNAQTSHIPVFMISSRTDSKDQLEAFKNGADDFIVKPFSMAVLNAKIRNVMRTQNRISDKITKSLDIEPEKISFNAMDEEILKKAISIVEKNIDNASFSTEEFAKEMNMSRSNLHIKLKALTGESSLDFIRKIRFKEACRLLEDGRYSIAEISDMVGFNTSSYFATCFRKYMGCLPTEWIKEHR